MKKIFVSHHQNTSQNNDTNTANKPFCVDMLKGRKTKKFPQLVTARMENKKRGQQEDQEKMD
jgi:hypothetical protein